MMTEVSGQTHTYYKIGTATRGVNNDTRGGGVFTELPDNDLSLYYGDSEPTRNLDNILDNLDNEDESEDESEEGDGK